MYNFNKSPISNLNSCYLDTCQAVPYISRLMRSTIVLTLLPVFLYSIIGWQWMFAMRLNEHQTDAWSAIYDEEELEIISVKADDAKNHDTFLVNDHELFHHGRYFDIKYKKRRGDEIVFYCHPDHEEEGLFASFDRHVKNDEGTTTCSKQKLLKIVKVSVFEKDSGKIIFKQNEICEINFQFDNGMNPFLPCNTVFVPPDTNLRVS